MAAGLQIAVKKIESFRTSLNQALQAAGSADNLIPVLPIDYTLELPEITEKLLDEIATIGPFGNQNPETLNSREGKEKLRNETLAEIQKVMTEETGEKGVENVFFTSFVMQ